MRQDTTGGIGRQDTRRGRRRAGQAIWTIERVWQSRKRRREDKMMWEEQKGIVTERYERDKTSKHARGEQLRERFQEGVAWNDIEGLVFQGLGAWWSGCGGSVGGGGTGMWGRVGRGGSGYVGKGGE
ncbi:hypothetical protein Pcinc_043308 [Petrolisthes cinctipes]|uniref:Uncharacterized protein n=1 Tax=Petrolisthes cinctipes TaxID=88211 RepID=A0AAE1EGC9_PETCI|nr:hypothetical protein Pcinc_043308 [Petrolisthes cinctipes]